MRIVYMGTPEFAVPSLKAVYEAGHQIELVVTQPDRRGNRGKVITSPVKAQALEYGLDIAQPYSIRKDEEFRARLKEINPDLIVVVAFGQILPLEVLELPKYGCINVHGSPLPKLRGASPMQAAVLSGDPVSGVTIMKMDVGLDTGDMLTKTECNIEGLYINEVADMLSEAGAQLLVETIPMLEAGTVDPVKQIEEESSYASMISKADGLTDFNEPAAVLERKLRAYAEWPTLHSYLGESTVKFYRAEVLDEVPDGEPGTVSSVDKKTFTVNCSEGKLRILELQLQGKKRMNTADFMRGHAMNAGDRFTAKEA